MKKEVQLALAGTAVTMVSLAMLSTSASAVVNFPRIARGINTWMARAMDQCNPATVSVVGTGNPTGGCFQANTTTEGSLTMKFAKLRVTQRGRIGLFASGFTLGDVLRVRLKLRVTRTSTTKHPPASSRVTFVDQTIDCPQSPDAFAARPNGAVVGSTDLVACLSPNTALATGNIEIVDVSLINALNGKTVAVPGILR